MYHKSCQDSCSHAALSRWSLLQTPTELPASTAWQHRWKKGLAGSAGKGCSEKGPGGLPSEGLSLAPLWSRNLGQASQGMPRPCRDPAPHGHVCPAQPSHALPGQPVHLSKGRGQESFPGLCSFLVLFHRGVCVSCYNSFCCFSCASVRLPGGVLGQRQRHDTRNKA